MKRKGVVMNKLFLPLILIGAISCSSVEEKSRKLASVEGDLTGTILGYAKYREKTKRKGSANPKFGPRYRISTKKRATRVYFKRAKENDGTYNVLLLEYVNLLKMAPKYVLSSKASEKINNVVGYLNQITKKVTMYKAFPTSDDKVYDLQKIQIVDGKLSSKNSTNPSQLVLKKDISEKNRLEGAKITASADGEQVEVYFPKEDDDSVSNGMQYLLAKFVYSMIDGFRSTWRDAYLTGDYLGAYADVKDVVLKLDSNGNYNHASFIENKDRTNMSVAKREKQMTNSKSAHIRGEYEVEKLDEAVFLFKAKGDGPHPAKEAVDQRIGLFVDIFDASQTKLKQDVVELIILNEDDPEDFLMYYEHPENGEGR